MKYFFTFFIFIVLSYSAAFAQQTIGNPLVTQGVLIKITEPLASFTPPSNWINEVVRNETGIINGPLNIEHRFHNRVGNAAAMIKKGDPVRQMDYNLKKKRIMNIDQNYDGQGFTSVSPADPSLCVGPSHVIQMINGSSGARLQIYNKSGGTLLAAQYMDAISGIGGLGDPVALYDQLADRYFITEFAQTGNKLIIMVSQTNNPLGSWYVYEFNTPEFPDYPKFGIWPNALICTTNESDNKVYAMDRVAMLAGNPTTTLITFTIAFSPSLAFQAAVPVNISGLAMPSSAPMVMRMTDNAWGIGVNDELQIWDLNLNFTSPASSTMTQQPSIPTAPFDSHLCGFVTLNCITQPGTNQKLDPIREVIMNRIYLRVFPNHQSMVLCHSVDATGGDIAGVRWYELRKVGNGPWSIYQESTYSPDANSRWMGTIGMDQYGNIGLAYNVSSNSVYPSVRITGRLRTDPLNQMTQVEQTLIAGTGAHTNNRWGDYNDLGMDPIDDATFWITGMYKPSSTGWATRVGSFNLSVAPLPLSFLSFTATLEGNDCWLQWTTTDERDVAVYAIERSTSPDFLNSDIIGSVNAKNTAKNEYAFKDINLPAAPMYYYRLKGFDIDGKFTYSKVETVLTGIDGNEILVYPNPINYDVVYIKVNQKMTAQTIHYSIYSAQGQKVKEAIFAPNESVHSCSLSDVTPGVYHLKLDVGKQTIFNKKLIIQ